MSDQPIGWAAENIVAGTYVRVDTDGKIRRGTPPPIEHSASDVEDWTLQVLRAHLRQATKSLAAAERKLHELADDIGGYRNTIYVTERCIAQYVEAHP